MEFLLTNTLKLVFPQSDLFSDAAGALSSSSSISFFLPEFALQVNMNDTSIIIIRTPAMMKTCIKRLLLVSALLYLFSDFSPISSLSLFIRAIMSSTGSSYRGVLSYGFFGPGPPILLIPGGGPPIPLAIISVILINY